MIDEMALARGGALTKTFTVEVTLFDCPEDAWEWITPSEHAEKAFNGACIRLRRMMEMWVDLELLTGTAE